jgi:DNA-binding LytR/AlgR family response regulator
MNKYQCVIIDDEPLAQQVIRSHIEKLDSFEVSGTFRNALEATDILSKRKIDLLFLDIQMPGMKGTDFLRNMMNPPKTILTTAYREYALEGYELDVVDYLLKPVSFDRFFKAINKFLMNNAPERLASGSEETETAAKDFVYLNVNKKIHKIIFSEIVFVESTRDYLTIHTGNDKIVVKHTLSAMEEILPCNDFIRIHRSFLVSLRYIKSFTAHTVNLGFMEIPIGKNYQVSFFKAVKYPHFIQPEDE